MSFIKAVVAVCLLGFLFGANPAAESIALTVVNYRDLPVYAYAVELDAEVCRSRLGVPPGSPLGVSSSDGREHFPLYQTTRDGRSVVLVPLSLPPRTRKQLRIRGGSGTVATATATADAVGGTLRNGVVRLVLAAEGWSLGFDPPAAGEVPPTRDPLAEAVGEAPRRGADAGAPWTMIQRAGLEFWIDTRNRGRLANEKPETLGLVPFPAGSTRESCLATIAADGTPMLTVTHRMTGAAQAVRVREVFSLPLGQPYVTCHLQWENLGTEPVWIAYVGSGSGIKGSWGGKLMADPLIERFKFPTKGYLNGAETRPAWNGPLARVSMESESMGCGVGLSTLLPTPGAVGQGSMIWGINRSGFQVNLIDPEVGQFPFPLAPQSQRKNGNAFILTQTGISTYRQTVALWDGLTAGRTPRLHAPCAVFLDGVISDVQSTGTTGEVSSLLEPVAGDLVAALRVDFNRQYRCTGSARVGAQPIEVVFQAREAKAKPVVLGTISASGDFSFDLNAVAKRVDEIPFSLTFRHGHGVITNLALSEVMTAIPTPWSPLPDATCTDIATMFRWQAIPLVVDYDLQLAATADFAQPRETQIRMSADCPWYIPPADRLPAAGDWFWRIRGRKGPVIGPWSVPRRFTVTTDLGLKPLVRPVSPAQPLFTLEASRWVPFTSFAADIPAAIRPSVAIVVEGFIGNKDTPTIDQALAGVERIGHPFLMRTHPPTQISLADIEWTCQHYPNFIGIQGGETIKKIYEPVRGATGDGDYHRRMLKILAKYGRFYHEADGTYRDDAWQDLWDQQGPLLRTHGHYLILTQKNNIIRRQFYSESAAMGLWLGDITLAHGAWEDGGFYWQNAGFDGVNVCRGERSGKLVTMPRIWWALMCVQGLARGCSIYSLDGQTLQYGIKGAARDPAGPWKSALWNDAWQMTDTWKRFVEPLIQATLTHHLVPDRATLTKDLRLAVYNDRKTVADPVAWPHYVEYGPLYAGTYGFKTMGGIHGQLWELFPNTGRYHRIPVLPQGDVPLAPGITNLPLSSLQDPAAVTATFNAAYPAWYAGDAFASHSGDLYTVMNGNENQDLPQTFSIPVGPDLVTSFSGTVQVHSYVLAKREDQGAAFWLQANTEYPDRDTELAFVCSRQPIVTAVPAAAANSTWDPATRTLRLRLQHRDGAVEVTLR